MGHKLNSIHYLFKTGAIWSRQYAECNHLFWLVIFYLHIHNERIYYAKASIPPLSLCFSCHQYFCLQSATTTIIAAFACHSKIAKYTVCVYKLASCLNQTGTAFWMFIIFFSSSSCLSASFLNHSNTVSRCNPFSLSTSDYS